MRVKHLTTVFSLLTTANGFNSFEIHPFMNRHDVLHGGINSDVQQYALNKNQCGQRLFMNAPTKEDLVNSQSKEQSFDPLSLSTNTQLDKDTLIINTDDNNKEIGIWAARGLLFLVAVLWGTNFASVKYLETLCFHPPCSHPPSEAALARFGVAALVSLPLLINQRKDIILAGIECGIWITLGYFTQALALSTVPSGKCAFICSLTVVVVPLISAIFFGKKIKPVNVASAALALSGIGILEGLVDFREILGISPAIADVDVSTLSRVTESATEAASSSITTASAAVVASSSSGIQAWLSSATSFAESIKGDLLALGQPFGFGLAFMRIEHYVEKFKDVENRILTISAAQCVSVGFLAFLWVLYDFHGVIPNMAYMIEPHRIGAIAWTGIMTTVVAIYFEGIALQKASATEASLIFSSEPVWASIFGTWLLHEQLGLNSYIGGAAILLACVLGALVDIKEGFDTSDEKTIDADFE